MKAYTECIPCQIRSAIIAVKNLTDDEKLANKIIHEVLVKTSQFFSYENIIEFNYVIMSIIKKYLPDGDPYYKLKKDFNKICLSISKQLINEIEDSDDWFEKSLRICLAGNSIDVMQGKKLSRHTLLESIEAATLQHLDQKIVKKLKYELKKAQNILFIGDNAGEIVFDKIFIGQLNKKMDKKGKITYVVRSNPVLNDSTIDDAKMVSMQDVAEVITTGIDMAGAYLHVCSKKFMEAYRSADIIISKGQGNLEGLMDENENIFFLLKVKCDVIAGVLDKKYKVGDIVIYKK